MACHQLAIPFRSVLHRTGCTAAASVQPPAPRPTGRWARARRASVQKYRPYTVRPRVLVSFRFPSSRPLLLTPTSRRVQLDASSPPLAVGCCLLACLARPTALPSSSSSLLFPGNGGPGDPRRARMAAAPSRSRGDYDHLIKLLLIGDSGAFPPPSSPDSILRGSGGAATLGLPVRSPD
jgi:hypothetical protein